MQSIGRDGYSTSEVLEVLRGPSREWRFRYELLDLNNQRIRDLAKVESCRVEQNALATIKRTAKLRLETDAEINFLTDRVRPWVGLRMPDGGFVEWPQGVFLMSSPRRTLDASGRIIREVDAYDQLLVYRDDKFADRYTVAQGATYTTVVNTLLGSVSKNVIPKSDAQLPASRDWPPGTSKLEVINSLLTAINYETLFFDSMGVAQARPYQSPQVRPSEFTYETNQESLVLPEAVEERDLFFIPNRWVLVVSEPDQEPLSAVYTNDNPASATSTVNRGRVITDFREEETASSQAVLNDKAARLAFAASQVYEVVEFSTGVAPWHEHNDVYTLTHPDLGVSAKFSEHTWTLPMQAGANMRHRIRRVVSV